MNTYTCKECSSAFQSEQRRHYCSHQCQFDARVTKQPNGCWTANALPRKHATIKPYGLTTMGFHRFSWLLHNGPIPSGQIVCHRCDNPPCVNPDHLELGDYSKNLFDAYERGLNGKITPSIAKLIVASKEDSATLAERFGCTATNVYMIRSGKTWRKHTGL